MGVYNLNLINVQADNVQQTSEPIEQGQVAAPDQNTDSSLDGISEAGKNATIVLDGPLSRIYTEALNKVYSLEDTGQMLKIAEDMQGEEVVDTKGTYVYCVDTSKLSRKDLLESMDQLNAKVKEKTWDHVILVLNTDDNAGVNSNAQHLDQYASTMVNSAGISVEVYRNKNTSISRIRNILEGK